MERGTNPNNNSLSVIKTNNHRKITELYNEHKTPFISYSIKNFDITRDIAEDIYQDAFLALHQNVQNGKLEDLTVPLRSYLFQIGKNKIYDHFKKAKKEVEIEKISHILSSDGELGNFDSIYADEESPSKQKELIVYNTIRQLESPCKEVLSYYYWDKKSMKEISELMDYSSADVAKTQKSKCMKRIKAYIVERFKKANLS